MISTDQLGTQHTFISKPKRIISLVPSITELLCDLGLYDWIVGCTKFCVHPSDLRSKIQIIGGTKNVKYDLVAALEPDIIIANKEENNKADIETLVGICPIWISDIKTIEDSYSMISDLGMVFSKLEKAQSIIADLQQIMVKGNVLSGSVAYLIWKDPFMTVGNDTYIHNILEKCGLSNVYVSQQRYPEITLANLKQQQADYIFLSSEPFPFQQKHIAEIQERIPDSKIVLVDGEYFSWYGSRLLHLSDYIDSLRDTMSNL